MRCKLARRLRGLPTQRFFGEDGPHPPVKAEPTAQPDSGFIPGGRATSVPFTTGSTGPQRTTTDNAKASSTCTAFSRRRSPTWPIWLWEQVIALVQAYI